MSWFTFAIFLLPVAWIVGLCHNEEAECEVESLLQTRKRNTTIEDVAACKFSLMPEEASPVTFATCEISSSDKVFYIIAGKMDWIPPLPKISAKLENIPWPAREEDSAAPPWEVEKAPTWRLLSFEVARDDLDFDALAAMPSLAGEYVHYGNHNPLSIHDTGRELVATAYYRNKTYQFDATNASDASFQTSGGFGGGSGYHDLHRITFRNGLVFWKLQAIPDGMYYSVDSTTGESSPFLRKIGRRLLYQSREAFLETEMPLPDWSFTWNDGHTLGTGYYSYGYGIDGEGTKTGHHSSASGHTSYSKMGDVLSGLSGGHLSSSRMRHTLLFDGRELHLGPDFDGRWESSDCNAMRISFNSINSGNRLYRFLLKGGEIHLNTSMPDCGGTTALWLDEPAKERHGTGRESDHWYGCSRCRIIFPGYVYERTQPFTEYSQTEKLSTQDKHDGMYYKGDRPFAMTSGHTLATASGQYTLSDLQGPHFQISGNFGGGSGTFTASSIEFSNAVTLTLGVNLNGVWLFRGKPLFEIFFGTITYRKSKYTWSFTEPPSKMQVSGRFGGGLAIYDPTADTITFKNGAVISRVAISTTTTTSLASVGDFDITQRPKEMDVLMIICEFEDEPPHYVTETTAVSELFDGPGSVSEMIKSSTYGRLILPKERSKVVTVSMKMRWNSQSGCPYRNLGERALQMVREQHGVRAETFTYREFFFPRGPHTADCTWAGLANVGCGHPSMLPNPGQCNLYYRYHFAFVRAHELGHTLGLSHAGGRNLGGRFLEYGDASVIMGNSYVFSSYSAASAYQIGGLKDAPGEVLRWSAESSQNLFRVQSLTVTQRVRGADGIAVKISCPSCVPQVSRYARAIGGWLWVSFRGDEGFSKFQLKAEWQNKVYIHLARSYVSRFYGKGTELWATLSSGESYTVAGFAFLVCGIAGDLANVAIDVDLGAAQRSCKTPDTR